MSLPLLPWILFSVSSLSSSPFWFLVSYPAYGLPLAICVMVLLAAVVLLFYKWRTRMDSDGELPSNSVLINIHVNIKRNRLCAPQVWTEGGDQRTETWRWISLPHQLCLRSGAESFKLNVDWWIQLYSMCMVTPWYPVPFFYIPIFMLQVAVSEKCAPMSKRADSTAPAIDETCSNEDTIYYNL